MKICKKLLTVLLAALMIALTCVCLLPTAGAVTALRNVNVTISHPIIGQHPSTVATLPSDAHCIVTKLEWWPSEDYANDAALDAEAVFADQVYLLRIWLKPKTGYMLPGGDGHDGTIAVNGTTAYSSAYNTVSGEVEYRAKFQAMTDNRISTLEIDAPIPVVGEIPDTARITLTPGFTVLSKAIQVFDGQKWREVTGSYRAGEAYRVQMLLSPMDCYTYADDVTVTVNGEDVSVGRSGGNYLIVFSLPSPVVPVLPEQPADDPVVCSWCGKVHDSSFFQKIIAFIHGLLARVFGKRFK